MSCSNFTHIQCEKTFRKNCNLRYWEKRHLYAGRQTWYNDTEFSLKRLLSVSFLHNIYTPYSLFTFPHFLSEFHCPRQLPLYYSPLFMIQIAQCSLDFLSFIFYLKSATTSLINIYNKKGRNLWNNLKELLF